MARRCSMNNNELDVKTIFKKYYKERKADLDKYYTLAPTGAAFSVQVVVYVTVSPFSTL